MFEFANISALDTLYEIEVLSEHGGMVPNEDSCSFLKKRTKRLFLLGAGPKIADLAGD